MLLNAQTKAKAKSAPLIKKAIAVQAKPVDGFVINGVNVKVK